MNESQKTPDEEMVGEKGSEEERRQELVRRVLQLLKSGDQAPALALFHQLHPVDQGEVLMGLAQGPQRGLLTTLPPAAAAEILEHLEAGEAAQLAEGVEAPALPPILDETSLSVAADILRRLPSERSVETLGKMRRSEEVSRLLGYRDDCAGGLMTPDYPAVRDGYTAATALDTLRALGERAESIGSVFIVDQEGRLVGTLGMARLALARPSVVVGDIMDRDVISIAAEADQEECARLMERYDVSQLPVVDRLGRLVGAIPMEEMVDVVEEEATEDMYRMASIAGERALGSLRNSVRRRLPWLILNLATAFMAALVISLFESTIARVVVLVLFLPVIAGQGGIGGTQTLTLVVRGMALGEIGSHRGMHILGRELMLGAVHGLLLGLMVGLVAYAWKGNVMLGVVVGVAMMGNMLVAGFTGAGVPLLLRRMGMDPAVSSAVFVTTVTDVVGFLMFLGLAAALVNFLV